MDAVLGIDVGLSGVRAAVMREDGCVVARARAPLSARFEMGIAEHEAGDWVRGALDAGGRAVREAEATVSGVAVSALGPAPVLVDRDGNAMAPVPLFGLDRRADPWRARLGTGPDHAAPTLLRWHEIEPELARRARTVLDAAGFVVRWFTGVDAMDRITASSYRWDGIDLPVEVPVPTEPDAVAGPLCEPAASALAVPEGTPVAVGTIDCFADLWACGVERPGQGAILLGSTLIVYAVADRAPVVAGLETTSHIGAGWLVGGSTASAGLALDWTAEVLGDPVRLAERAAELEPGHDGMMALPYLAGERTPIGDPDARGVLAGFSLATRPEHLYRAMIDGVALTALDHALRLEEAGLVPDRFRVAGGGVLNGGWLTASCDAVGRPFDVMPDAGEAVGAAILAFRMLGRRVSREPEHVIEPDAGRHERYRELMALSQELWRASAASIHALARRQVS